MRLAEREEDEFDHELHTERLLHATKEGDSGDDQIFKSFRKPLSTKSF